MFLDHHRVVVVVVVKEEEVERYYGADVRCIVSFALQINFFWKFKQGDTTVGDGWRR
jgi:hypothetical protein